MSCIFKLISPPTITSYSRILANYSSLSTITNLRFASTNRVYTEKHEWISLKDNDKHIGRVGISNHAQEALGDVVYVQMPDVGASFKQFDEAGAIESVKAASEITSPVTGEITSINESLEQKPSLVNSSCYDEGWLFEIKLSDQKELDNLMDEDKYNEFLEKTASDN